MKIYIRNLILILIFPVLLLSCQEQQETETNYLKENRLDFNDRMSWWRDATFGMFIHWGAYAVPAGIYQGKEIPGIGEWIMDRAKIPVEEYEKFVGQFNPTRFDAREWARIAKDAGMKYMVITSKHHDGFCLWDSKVSDYDVMDAAPIQRDLLKELADACNKEGVRLCFYHSIMDWHHPDAKGNNFAKYREEYLIPQLDELLSGDYGDVGILWFDGEWISEWTEEQGKALYQHLRSLKPDLIINNRVGKGRQGMQGMNKDKTYAGDFGTPEQEILDKASALDWESCMTMNNTWGFKKNDHNWKSAEMLIHNLVDIIAKGGNYLLNVGPTAEGLIPEASVERLAEMGEWIRVNKEAIYKTQRFEHFKEGEKIRYIQDKKGKYVYAVTFEWPGEVLNLYYAQPNENTKISLLGYPGKLDWEYNLKTGLSIQIPDELQDPENRPCEHAWVFKMQAIPAGIVSPPVVDVDGKTNPKTVVFFDEVFFVADAPRGAKIQYTRDLSSSWSRTPYLAPTRIDSSVTIWVRAIEDGKFPSEIITVRFVKSSKFKRTGGSSKPHSRYPGQGIDGFLSFGDGLRGDINNIQDGAWLGFEGENMEVGLELDEIKSLSRIEAGFLQNIGSWIFLPEKIEFFAGTDPKSLKKVGELKHKTSPDEMGKKVIDMGIDLNSIDAKYIKIIAHSIKTCPDWHQGAGGEAWIFCDEIMMN
ncbi:MAG: alpha-L-fucosidase [Bacteroidota bacterium]|nr:alpha-L-fucosidase [Bacteroidota bacterium]